MLKIQEIREIIKLIDQSDIGEFTYENDDAKIKLKKSANTVAVQEAPVIQEAPKPVVEKSVAVQTKVEKEISTEVQSQPEVAAPTISEEEASNLHKISSPMVGTFYQAPSPDSDPYVKVGDTIESDTIVCIVEAMKLFNEIEAEVEGEIVEVLVKDGELVEYGQPLFLVQPK